MDASSFTAQNPRFNASLNRAHQIQSDLIDQGISKNPRIYANQVIQNGAMIPETAAQDNSDLSSWATQNWDGSTTLQSLGLPSDQAVYLDILVAEGSGGGDNFCNVAQIDLEMQNDGKTLREAVNVK